MHNFFVGIATFEYNLPWLGRFQYPLEENLSKDHRPELGVYAARSKLKEKL
jgi:hypothetical protein